MKYRFAVRTAHRPMTARNRAINQSVSRPFVAVRSRQSKVGHTIGIDGQMGTEYETDTRQWQVRHQNSAHADTQKQHANWHLQNSELSHCRDGRAQTKRFDETTTKMLLFRDAINHFGTDGEYNR